MSTSRKHAGNLAEHLGIQWRRATFFARPLPRFLILGAQRCGTTSLYEWLCLHPQIEVASQKEIHYFDLNYQRGNVWYRSHFPLTRPGRISGEATPYLLYHPLAPQRVSRDLSAETVLIAILRDPSERAISHYWHERRLGVEKEPLAKALDLESSRLLGTEERVRKGEYSFEHQHFSYTARGEYARQLRHWFDYVAQDRILVIDSEELFSSAFKRANLLRHLDVDAAFDIDFLRTNAESRPIEADDNVKSRLQAQFSPHNEDLFMLIGRRLWNR